MTEKVKVEVEVPREPDIDFEKFKKKTGEGAIGGKSGADETRRERARERVRARRAAAKAEASAIPEFDLATCGPVNEYVLAVAGAVTHREIQISEAQKRTMDASLVKIANKYGGWLAEYASEILYGVTIFVVVSQSPRMGAPAVAEVSGAEGAEQDRPDPGAQGLG